MRQFCTLLLLCCCVSIPSWSHPPTAVFLSGSACEELSHVFSVIDSRAVVQTFDMGISGDRSAGMRAFLLLFSSNIVLG